MELNLHNKVAMVGGASKGLGFATCRALALEGALISMASRDGDALIRAADALHRETGHRPLIVPSNLALPDDVSRWHEATCEHFGGVDLVYANTGGPPVGHTLDFTDDVWRDAFELLVLSVVRLVRLVVPSMQQRGGGAILVGTSSSVKEPIPNLALSTVLRASVAALTKTLALELGPLNIRVNQLIPGRIESDRLVSIERDSAERSGVSFDQQRQQNVSAIPLGRYGQPEEFGSVAAFLLSDAAAYITGASLQVDGGAIKSTL